MRTKSISLNKLILSCLIIFSIIPDIGIKFSTGGFTWTIYRSMIVLGLIAVLIGSKVIILETKNLMSRWIVFMGFWAIYGLILLFIGKYSDPYNGFIEWLSIFNGLIVFYIMSRFLNSNENRDTAINLIYCLLNIMIVIGIAETVTGRHLMTSAYYDTTSSIFEYSNSHMATGLMYNMNDFSAMITCMAVVLLDKRLGKKRLVTLIGVLFINLVNDATACTFAIVVFAMFYLLIIRGGKTQKAYIYRFIFWILLLGMIIFFIMSGVGLADRSGFIGSMARQLANAKRSTGSLYVRLIMYQDAIRAWLSTGMLGIGPGGYSNYFTINRSLSGLVNPHSLILEVLSQYGIIICAWLVRLLFKMYCSGRKMYEMTDDKHKTAGLMVVAFVIVYSIASFAPSTFIGYAYQWLLLAVMCSQLNYSKEIGGI